MRSTLQGLEFEVFSPSFYRLAPSYTGHDTVDISYVGGEWMLFHESPRGDVGIRCFATRDEAIGMIAQAFKNVGLLGPPPEH